MFNLREIRWKVTPHVEITLEPDRSLLVPLHRFNQVRIPVESNPTAAAFDGTHLWITNSGSDSVSKIDITTNKVVATVRVGINPWDIVFDGTHLWVTNLVDNTVSKINAATHQVADTIAVGRSPHGLAFDGAHIWVANMVDNKLSKIDAVTNVVVEIGRAHV